MEFTEAELFYLRTLVGSFLNAWIKDWKITDDTLNEKPRQVQAGYKMMSGLKEKLWRE